MKAARRRSAMERTGSGHGGAGSTPRAVTAAMADEVVAPLRRPGDGANTRRSLHRSRPASPAAAGEESSTAEGLGRRLRCPSGGDGFVQYSTLIKNQS
jgi:hypothetical protein